VDQHQARNGVRLGLVELGRERQGDAATEGMTDDGEVAQPLASDQGFEQGHLIEQRVALVERLIRAPETLEVNAEDAMPIGQARWRWARPGRGSPAWGRRRPPLPATAAGAEPACPH